MATALTPNLKLRLADTLTSDSIYNLNVIDQLASTFIVDTSNTLRLRSKSDILVEPASADIGGSGVGGNINFGTTSHVLSSANFYISTFSLSAPLSLLDQASGGTKYLQLQYKSGIQGGGTDTTASRNLYIDPSSGDRNLVLTGDFKLLGGFNLSLTLGANSSLTLPSSGTVATLAGTEVLTHKTIDGSLNTLVNLPGSSVTGQVPYANLNLTGSIVNADISTSAAIAGSKISPTFSTQVRSDLGLRIQPASYYTDILNASSGQTTNLVFRLPSTAGANQQVLSTDGSGNLSWFTTPGTGTVTSVGLSMPGIFSVSGSPVTLAGTLTASLASQSANSAFMAPDGASGTPSFRSILLSDLPTIPYSKTNLASSILNSDISNAAAIVYAKLVLTNSILNTDINASAAIAYSKLALTGSLVNADINASAAISMSKLAAVTASKALVSDVSGFITASSTSTTQLQYLNAATGTTGTTSTNLVFSTSPTLVTPVLGAATATSINSVAITAPLTSATLTLANGSTLATSGANSLTLTTTAATNVTLPTSGTLVGSADTGTVTSTMILDGTILNTDINASAAIAVSKLAAMTAKGVVSTDASGFLTSTALTNGQLLIGSTSNVPVAATLTGTTNQITVTNSTGSITLATPQNIHTGATPAFSSLTLSANSANLVLGTTNTITMQVPSLSGSYTLTLPTTAGSLNQVLTTNGSGTLSWTSGAALNSYTTTWGNADGSTKTVTHNLGTRDVMVQVVDANSPYDRILTNNEQRTDTNTVTLIITNTPASFSWQVLIWKLG